MTGQPIPHEAMRPLWKCRNCAADWPCQPAKQALLHEYDHDWVGLLLYLGGVMMEATDQLRQLNEHAVPDDMPKRFMGWARPKKN